ncbi:hypothetical protein GFY24_22145 [Nocardia sp. SYP-A9097]|uniref:hypothetical protein n=1 Tax=Nocardia sp. SYP-A9097 TaxID=2663237 RepID=UPI00129B4CA3|nr:hypothetical protein [Nocardia sp. SYP-A9097]MRH90110.1 hypothetical protein [Nocardia sp. SYP-A9097]
MLSRIHPIAGAVGLTTILTFWISTVVTEIFGSKHAIITLKQTIPWGLPILVLALALTGASGFRLAGGSTLPVILVKKRRMPFIAANGLLVLIPCAITLDVLAGHDHFGVAFYCVQAVELVAGAINIALMSLNVRDGLRLTGRFGMTTSDPTVAVGSGESQG